MAAGTDAIMNREGDTEEKSYRGINRDRSQGNTVPAYDEKMGQMHPKLKCWLPNLFYSKIRVMFP